LLIVLRKGADFFDPEERCFERYGVDSIKIEAEPGTPKLSGPRKIVLGQNYSTAKLPQVADLGPFDEL
jgi:hypothetical protein